MSADPLLIFLGLETSEAEAKLQRLKVIADEVVKKAKEARAQVMREVRIAMNAISIMLTNFTQAMSLIGFQADAFYTALIGMVLSTISMLMSVSAALAATGFGAAVAGYVMAIAVGLQVVAIAKLTIDKIHSSGLWAQIVQSAGEASYRFRHEGPRTSIGGSF